MTGPPSLEMLSKAHAKRTLRPSQGLCVNSRQKVWVLICFADCASAALFQVWCGQKERWSLSVFLHPLTPVELLLPGFRGRGTLWM